MRLVSVKTPEQQSVLHLHHGRRLLVQQRVALSNHLRSVLLEYAIAIPVGDTILMQQLPELLEDADNELPILSRQLQAWHQQSETSRRLETIPGVGLLTASALAAALGEGKDFKHGRQLAAYPGLVPRQASSGGKERLPGISKRGDGYLRGLLIHGSRAVIRHIRRRLQAGQPGGNPWVLLARNETYRVSRRLKAFQ